MKKRVVETIQLFNAATLQQMNGKKIEKMINVDEKLAKNVKMKKIVEKRFSKEKKNSNTIIFEIINVKNPNAEIFIKYHIDDTSTTSSSFTKFFFEFESFLKEKNATQTDEKEQEKKEFEKEREQKLRKNKEKEDR